MAQRTLTQRKIERFRVMLTEEEKSISTVEKYIRDSKAFSAYCGGEPIRKETVIAYKQTLMRRGYAVRSINSKLASLNSLFDHLQWYELRVKSLRIQHQTFCPEEQVLTREEYVRLCRAAKRRNDQRLDLILQTVCCTGIRISELQYITVEAVVKGEAVVTLKGKTRVIIIVRELQRKLLTYAVRRNIRAGEIFVSRNGKPLDRSNIWRDMKELCAEAKVDPRKVYPHNLRHLFARTFYGIEKDIAKLADILGHSSIDTTRIYIVSTGAEHRKKMEQMHLTV